MVNFNFSVAALPHFFIFNNENKMKKHLDQSSIESIF